MARGLPNPLARAARRRSRVASPGDRLSRPRHPGGQLAVDDPSRPGTRDPIPGRRCRSRPTCTFPPAPTLARARPVPAGHLGSCRGPLPSDVRPAVRVAAPGRPQRWRRNAGSFCPGVGVDAPLSPQRARRPRGGGRAVRPGRPGLGWGVRRGHDQRAPRGVPRVPSQPPADLGLHPRRPRHRVGGGVTDAAHDPAHRPGGRGDGLAGRPPSRPGGAGRGRRSPPARLRGHGGRPVVGVRPLRHRAAPAGGHADRPRPRPTGWRPLAGPVRRPPGPGAQCRDVAHRGEAGGSRRRRDPDGGHVRCRPTGPADLGLRRRRRVGGQGPHPPGMARGRRHRPGGSTACGLRHRHRGPGGLRARPDGVRRRPVRGRRPAGRGGPPGRSHLGRPPGPSSGDVARVGPPPDRAPGGRGGAAAPGRARRPRRCGKPRGGRS